MGISARLAAALVILLAATHDSHGGSGPSRVAVVHVSVIDVEKGTATPDQTVLISGDRIVSIGKSRPGKGPNGFTVINGTNKYLVPGYWDMHVHVAGLSADPTWSKQLLLPLLLPHGITGIRDMGGNLQVLKGWRAEIKAGVSLGPEIVAAGPMLDNEASDRDVRVVASPGDAEQVIAALKKQGSDFIKILSGLSREGYDAVLKSAKKHHLPVAGHVPTAISLEEASEKGQRSVEHILYSGFLLAASDNEASLRPQLEAAFQTGRILEIGKVLDAAERTYNPEKAAVVWQKLKNKGTAVTPTLVAVQTQANLDRRLEPNVYAQYVPRYVMLSWTKQKVQARSTPEKIAWYNRELGRELKIVGELHKAGVLLLAGTDSLDPYNMPGESLHRELELFTDAGLTPAAALETATLNPAVVLGRLNDFGTVSPGKVANLVLLDANPLEQITNARRIDGVFLRGKFFTRAELDGMLENVRRRAADVKQ